MADKPFRVLLDLTDLFLENLKYVWINVSPRELTSISDFKTALLHKINLQTTSIKLFVREGLLLEQETVNVLREDDTVKVQYEVHSGLNSGNNAGKEAKKRKRNHSECNIVDVHSKEKKNKLDCEISNQSSGSNFCETSTEIKKRKKKSSYVLSMNNVPDYFENLESNQNGTKSQKKKINKKYAVIESSVKECDMEYDSFFSFDVTDATIKQNESSTCLVAADVNEDSSMFDSTKDSSKMNVVKYEERTENCTKESFKVDVEKVEVVNNCPKKRRKRHRKRKNTGSICNNDLSNSENFPEFSSLTENVHAEEKHVKFPSVTCEKGSVVDCDTENGVSNSPSNTFSVIKNTSIKNVNNQSFKDYPKISTPAQSAVCSKPSWCVSLMSQNSSGKNVMNEQTTCKVKPPKESTVGKSVVKNNLQDSQENNFQSEIQYENLPALHSVPKIGTHFIYKTLELDESYSPTISEYREGIVKSINPDTEEIEIELSKHMIKPGRRGKFENLKEDEIPIPEVKKIDILRWSAIISPKLCLDF